MAAAVGMNAGAIAGDLSPATRMKPPKVARRPVLLLPATFEFDTLTTVTRPLPKAMTAVTPVELLAISERSIAKLGFCVDARLEESVTPATPSATTLSTIAAR